MRPAQEAECESPERDEEGDREEELDTGGQSDGVQQQAEGQRGQPAPRSVAESDDLLVLRPDQRGGDGTTSSPWEARRPATTFWPCSRRRGHRGMPRPAAPRLVRRQVDRSLATTTRRRVPSGPRVWLSMAPRGQQEPCHSRGPRALLRPLVGLSQLPGKPEATEGAGSRAREARRPANGGGGARGEGRTRAGEGSRVPSPGSAPTGRRAAHCLRRRRQMGTILPAPARSMTKVLGSGVRVLG